MTRNFYSDYWEGYIKVIVVSSLKEIPGKARYKYTDYDQSLDIYDFEDKIFGVIIG